MFRLNALSDGEKRWILLFKNQKNQMDQGLVIRFAIYP